MVSRDIIETIHRAAREADAEEARRKRRATKVERSRAAQAVDECLLKGGSLREASTIFHDITGEKISLGAMSHHYGALQARARHARALELLARELAGRAGEGGLGTLALQMLQAQALEAAAELDDLAFEDLPAERLCRVAAALARAAAQQESLRLRREDMETRARSRALGELEAALKRRPGLWAQVQEALGEEEETASGPSPEGGAGPADRGAADCACHSEGRRPEESASDSASCVKADSSPARNDGGRTGAPEDAGADSAPVPAEGTGGGAAAGPPAEPDPPTPPLHKGGQGGVASESSSGPVTSGAGKRRSPRRAPASA